MNKRLFTSIKEWMDELIKINKEFFEIMSFSEDVTTTYAFMQNKIQIHEGIEKMAKAVAAQLEISIDNEWTRKSFIYMGFEFFELYEPKEKDNYGKQ